MVSPAHLPRMAQLRVIGVPETPQPSLAAIYIRLPNWMRCIQCLKLLRRERQRERDGILLYVRHGTGFGNCDNVTAADCPGQRNSGYRATVCCTNTRKRGITQQSAVRAAERRIGHHRHAVPLAPWQQVMFNAAVAFFRVPRGETSRRAGCGKSARPVVCPVKAGVFSRRQTCRGNSQAPRSLDSRVAGNQDSEAYRQGLPWGDHESPGRNESERASGLENEWIRGPSLQLKGEGSMGC